MSNNETLEQLLIKSIEAQNRTTYAVRALATYLLIQVPFATVGGLLVFLPGTSGGTAFFGQIIIVIGFLIALFVAANELGKSKVSTVQIVDAKRAQNLEIAEVELSRREYWHWMDVGQPNLDSWIAAGKPPYISWQATQSSRSASE